MSDDDEFTYDDAVVAERMAADRMEERRTLEERASFALLAEEWKKSVQLASLDKKSPLEGTAKLTEEVGELMREVLILSGAHGTTYRASSHAARVEELADVLLCAFALQHKLNVSNYELVEALRIKRAKWKSKVDG